MNASRTLKSILRLAVLGLAALAFRAEPAACAQDVKNGAKESTAKEPTNKSEADKNGSDKSSKEVEAESLTKRQEQIAEKFKRLEDALLRMSELGAQADPARAALLRKAIAQSKEQLIDAQFERLEELLRKDQLSRAAENNAELDQDLRTLLELLQSENRSKRLESEKARLRGYIKDLNGVIKREREIQTRTADGDPRPLADEQKNIAEKTDRLSEDMRRDEDRRKTPGAKPLKSDDAKKPSDAKPSESTPPGQSPSKNGKDGSPDSSKNGPTQESPQGDGAKKEGEAKKEESQEKEEGNPARKRIEAAKARMLEAEERLRQAQRDEASAKQEAAVRELQRAKAALEEALRQLREEEIERALTALETRFRRMLEAEQVVYDGTVKLDKLTTDARGRDFDVNAARLGAKQSQICADADKALVLLRDDGTSAAYLEATEQIRSDMAQIAERLSQAKVGEMTQNVQKDVIASLEEMIESLKKAKKDQQDKKDSKSSGGGGGGEDSPLVDQLAELKMLRAMQVRVNQRTDRYAKLVGGEQADNPDVIDALRRLADRQEKIYRVTKDIQTGKNQ